MKLLKLFLILSVSSFAFGAAEKKDNNKLEIEALQEHLKKLTLQVASLQKAKHVSGEMAANPAQQPAPNQPAVYRYVVKTTKEDGRNLKITKMEDLTSGSWFEKTVTLVNQGNFLKVYISEKSKGSPDDVEILRKSLQIQDELIIAIQVEELVHALKKGSGVTLIKKNEEVPAHILIQLISHGDPSNSTIIKS